MPSASGGALASVPSVGGGAASPPLFAFILGLTGRVHPGQGVVLRYFVSDPSLVTVEIRHHGHVVAVLHRTVSAGSHWLSWRARTRGRRAPYGGYNVILLAQSNSQKARDGLGYVLVRKRR